MKSRLTVIWCVLAVILAVVVAGCNTAPEPGNVANAPSNVQKQKANPPNTNLVVSTPLATSSRGESSAFVSLDPSESGIDFVNEVTDTLEIPVSATAFPGLATGDIDGDSDLDVYFCGFDNPNRLYRNDGEMRFTDITSEAGEGLGEVGFIPNGAVFSDLDGDSDIDLYVCNRRGMNRLFINDGSGNFIDEAEARGVASASSTVMASVFDADQDGDLDIYLANNHPDAKTDSLPTELLEKYQGKTNFKMNPETATFDLPPDLAEAMEVDSRNNIFPRPHADQLLLNDGSGNFSDGTVEAGLFHQGWTLHALVSDFNDDTLPDIYVSGDGHSPDHYFINQGNGKFTNEAKSMLRTTPYYSMGSDAGDVNGDGLMDIFVGDMAPTNYKDGKKQSGDMFEFRWDLVNLVPQQNMRNYLYLNRGDGWMTDVAQMASVKSSDWSWSCRIADLDCSGIPELFVSNGFIEKAREVDNRMTMAKMIESGASSQELMNYRINKGPWLTDNIIFTAKTHLSYRKAGNNWGMHDYAIGSGSALEDFDGDGDLDIIINNTDSLAGVWQNNLEVGNRVTIDLRQVGANSEAVDSRVWAYCQDDVFAQDVILARGFATGASSRIHLGLGEHEKIDKLEIRWPDGKLQIENDLAVNQHYTIQRGGDLPDWVKETPSPLFAQTDIPWRQEEVDTLNPEFRFEPLLPIQRSLLGTGVGVADFNGDGNLDVYLAGPSGQVGQLMAGDGQGGFSPSPELDGKIDAEVEEMGVLWFDANGDSRPDLFITCGGIEHAFGRKQTRDRLFINRQTGFLEFLLPPMNLPTGAVAAADIDGDGDLDLAICSRAFPGMFMKTAPSTIWQNDGEGNFTENLDLAPGFDVAGVISDAQFADLNNDGLPDLVLAAEFGTVQTWLNQGGKIVKSDASPSGMWSSLGIADFDNDGDLDIMAGNWGLNTKYHPKPDKPYTLVADDFDGNGTRDLIEVKYGSDGLLPGRGRSCSGYAIEYIPEKWPTWASYADATFEEIYGPIENCAERFDAETLDTMLLVNDGSGKFAAGELPLAVQYSPAFGITTGDFNLDGNLDVCMANNFYGPQPETGHWTNGYGVVLLGNGDCSFKALAPTASGLSMFEDGRGTIAADFTGDGLLDVLMSASNASPKLITAQASADGQGASLMVNVAGKAPNTAAVGARLKLRLDSGAVLTREISAGSGYLSSYSGSIHFGIPEGSSATKLEILWPDGTTSSTENVSGGSVDLTQE